MEAEVQVHTPLAKPHVWAQGHICPEEGTHFLILTKVPRRLEGLPILGIHPRWGRIRRS